MNNSNNETAGLLDFVKAWPQYILPHYALSNLMHALTRSKTVWWKNFFIRWFIKQYKINMSEANPSDPSAYASFNEFFTRPLQTQARPIAFGDKHIVSPVDGAISQSGDIVNGNVFQAKGRSYTLHELLAGEQQWVDSFNNGHFATIYLSPKDYHRIHMPRSGHLVAMSHIPGRLFSVNPATTRAIPRLFARNERVIAYFETPAGPMAMILVGAIFVAGMETVWHGAVSPPHGRHICNWNYKDKNIVLEQGMEMGRFNMGSTVILLFPPKSMAWQNLAPGKNVQMGQIIGEIQKT